MAGRSYAEARVSTHVSIKRSTWEYLTEQADERRAVGMAPGRGQVIDDLVELAKQVERDNARRASDT